MEWFPAMSQDLISPHVREYMESFTPPGPAELRVMEEYAAENNFPIIGPTAGYLCCQLPRMINAQSVFEMGSGYGCSTAWFAQAVQENGGGIVHHVVWDEDLSRMAWEHLADMGYGNLVRCHVREAVQTLREIPGPFDLIFMDIHTDGYPDAFPVIEEKLPSGGVLIVDNILWGGRIFNEQDASASTEGIREFTRTITPVRDGLLIAYKK